MCFRENWIITFFIDLTSFGEPHFVFIVSRTSITFVNGIGGD